MQVTLGSCSGSTVYEPGDLGKARSLDFLSSKMGLRLWGGEVTQHSGGWAEQVFGKCKRYYLIINLPKRVCLLCPTPFAMGVPFPCIFMKPNHPLSCAFFFFLLCLHLAGASGTVNGHPENEGQLVRHKQGGGRDMLLEGLGEGWR